MLETTSSVVRTIVEYAEQQNINMIVIGTTGRTGFERALLGSVDSGIVDHSKCSVVIAK